MHPEHRNLVALVAVVVLAIAVVVPIMSHLRRQNRVGSCALQIQRVAQSAVFWAESHKQKFPIPQDVDSPTTPRDVFSILVFNRYVGTEQTRCPGEMNPAYQNTSGYAHDEVIRSTWQVSATAQSPAFGDRGPKDGIHDPSSLTYLNHGSKRRWIGNIGMRDGAVLAWVQNPSDPNSFASRGPLNGVARDNYFARDLGGPNPTDIFLAKRGIDASGNWTVTWD